MKIISDNFTVVTKGHNEIINITEKVLMSVQKSGLNNGIINIFVVGSTAAITTMEYEPGLVKDLPEAFDKIAPVYGKYHHDNTWHDGNGYAHVRSSILGTSLSVPFENKELQTGTWQQLVLIDFDNQSRKRKIITKIIGD